jgi:hypothetical protein
MPADTLLGQVLTPFLGDIGFLIVLLPYSVFS